VPDGAPRDVGLGDLPHGDRGLHTGVDVVLALQEILQREAVHHRSEHAHVVGPGPLHAPVLQLGAAEEVPATDDHRDLGTGGHHLGDLPGDRLDHRGVHPDGATPEHLAAELEQHAAKSRSGTVGVAP
jgi:hypothetical protein